jgi:hypothetical protein
MHSRRASVLQLDRHVAIEELSCRRGRGPCRPAFQNPTRRGFSWGPIYASAVTARLLTQDFGLRPEVGAARPHAPCYPCGLRVEGGGGGWR